ncbi:uncharacterized protein LOC127251469 isoform X2 [Andrographis paniculata]|uniref:uncharacterized protein LOC127251469 isoform X2 n=1 Tax=Andrographis paniculata TaxID=175694 RepID=UPI0021E80335|nr:uncharacterized protein LOC127251469 isoform X2 [Andrographis paniculata]
MQCLVFFSGSAVIFLHRSRSQSCEYEIQMKDTISMRVLFCKINCPLMCFCKPSAAHLYATQPLKLENSPHITHSTDSTVSDILDKATSGIKGETVNGKHEAVSVLRSCIRKLPAHCHADKKIVQWADDLGNELAEIKEFESSETGDIANGEESSCCFCVIL